MTAPDEHVADRVDDYLHGLLAPEWAELVERHCARCPECGRALEQARRRRAALQAVPPSEASPALVRATLNRVEGHRGRRRRLRRRLAGGAFAALAASALVVLGLNLYYVNLKATPYDLVVLGQQQLLSGTTASLRLRVWDRTGQSAVAGVPVAVAMRGPGGTTKELARLTTDAQGGGNPRFELPDWADGNYELVVRAATRGGDEVVRRTVALRRSWKVMLASDKPVYQPGQTIRVRALALRRPDLKPVAEQPAVFTVADPKGNVLFKQQGATSKFGITGADCALAQEILEGVYVVACKVGDTESRQAVEVKRYVLPKFKVEVKPDRTYYAPGEPARCAVQADYFFGKPVAGGTVEVQVRGAGGKVLQTLPARTDDKGAATVLYPIPASQPGVAANADARLSFQVTVTDGAGQKVEGTAERLVTTQGVRIETIPEGGTLVLGVPNTVYVLVSRADGEPVPNAEVHVSRVDGVFRTDGRGATSFRVAPSQPEVSWTIRVEDGRGEVLARRHDRLACGQFPADFLLRTDRAVYRAGETVRLTALGGGGQPVFLDFIKDGQTLLTETVGMKDGAGAHAFDLPPDLFGTLQVVAYRLTDEGVAVRKARVLYVEAPDGLKVGASLDRKEYRPGKEAKLNLTLRDAGGKPVPGALSLAAVDEAVFAVLPQRPGSEQAFYTVEKELLKPVYALRPWAPGRRPGSERFDQALFAATARQARAHSLAVNSFPEKKQATLEARERGLGRVKVAWAFLLALALGGAYAGVWLYFPTSEVLKVHGVGLAFLLPLAAIIITSITALGTNANNTFSYVGTNVGRTSAVGGGADMWRMAPAKAEAGREMAKPLDDTRSMSNPESATPDEANRDGPPRVRQHFPETLLWRPQVITDDEGRASLTVGLADSITTWRLSASAVTADGRLGSALLPLKVFQPFFVELDLPVSLRRGDEVRVPAVVHNYLDRPQTVTLKLKKEAWFTPLGGVEQKLELGPREVRSTRFGVKVARVGEYALEVAALGERGVSDAVRRTIEVVPDGRRVETAFSGTLGEPAKVTLDVPAEAVEGSAKAFVKLYPSSFSQLVEGLDNIFRMPSGCFEQTSSTTYPNVLALDYLKRTGQRNQKVEVKARHFIHLGYQRLLSFEVKGGGFDWFGRAPANRTLTAYGLMEFEDMARVHEVDPNLIERTRNWLLAQRKADGAWEPEGHALHDDPTRGAGGQGRLATTAYIAWAVFAGGKAADQAPATADYLLAHPPGRIDDPNTLALVCSALLALEPQGNAVGPYLGRLEALKKTAEGGKLVYWEQPAGARTTFYGAGLGGKVETTALAALALLAGQRHPASARALAWLAANKDPNGTWHSTQATVLSLKALLAGTGKPLGGDGARRVEVRMGDFKEVVVIPADQAEVLKQLDLSKHLARGPQRLTLDETTGTAAGYQVSFRYHVPEPKSADPREPLGIELTYENTRVELDRAVKVKARAVNRMKDAAAMVMLDLPVPAGCVLVAEDFAKLVQDGVIARYQARPQGVLVYLRDLAPGKPLELTYRLRATMPAEVAVPGARVYEYYDPQKQGRCPGVRFTVVARAAPG